MVQESDEKAKKWPNLNDNNTKISRYFLNLPLFREFPVDGGDDLLKEKNVTVVVWCNFAILGSITPCSIGLQAFKASC